MTGLRVCDGAACAGLGVLGSMHWAVCVGLCALGCVSTGQRGGVHPWYLASWFCLLFVRVWWLSGACDFVFHDWQCLAAVIAFRCAGPPWHACPTIASLPRLSHPSSHCICKCKCRCKRTSIRLLKHFPSPTLPHTVNVDVNVNELRLGFSITTTAVYPL